MSCHKAIVVIAGSTHCFHEHIYIYIHTFIYVQTHTYSNIVYYIYYIHIIYIYIYIYIYIHYIYYIYSQDATGNNDHRKLKKTCQSNVKMKLDHFGNIVNLSDKLFSKKEFSPLNKNLNFCPTNMINKILTKSFLSFTLMLN